ncbi:MAG: DNA polymerase/3'-5' exonuclease PolX [Rhodoblastus sp.]|uniref:DNA polymerase/3'-5' exonuclease PolX n=1 Tax=Rhodoblastus sp. TaxID=1962975 RepID=UPI003F95689D
MTRERVETVQQSKVRNEDIARAFGEVADILALEEENPFRIRAYRNAARTLRGLGEEVAVMIARGGDPDDLPGIGKDLATQIREMTSTGHLAKLDRLRPEVQALALELCHVSGIGPRRAMDLCLGLKPRPHFLADVLAACREGRVRSLPGFGVVSEQSLAERLKASMGREKRFKLADVQAIANELLANLRGDPAVETAEMAGSYRRKKETVGDLDLVVASNAPERVTRRFLSMPEMAQVLATGRTKTSIVLTGGVQVDLRIVPAESFGAALLYFTGSKAHNIELRRMAQRQGMKINEYGVFDGKDRVAGATEDSIYRTFGLAYIEPELRENSGEIEAAAQGRLPDLVRLVDIKGDLHAHTSASDGMNNLREMALAARARGLDYMAVTDHSRRLTVAHGLTADRLLQQIDAIDRFNAENAGFTVLKGVEVDILSDGKLDLPDDALGRLDIVVAAIHSDFALSREKQTERILRALDNKYVSVLAHPTGRLLLERDACDIDMKRIFRAARLRGCFMEINAQPDRLDLSNAHCRMAREEGVKLSLGSDAHRVGDFADLAFGINQARRGWLEVGDIVNTRTVSELKALLAAAR